MTLRYSLVFLMGVTLFTTAAHSGTPELDACQRLLNAHTYLNPDIKNDGSIRFTSKNKEPKSVQMNLSLKKGKANLKVKKVSDESPSTSTEDIFEQGIYFWMVKGVARLPHPPKKKDILENGFHDFAVPLEPENPKSDQVIFHYRTLNLQDGTRSAILKSFSVVDATGRDLGSEAADALLSEMDSRDIDQAMSHLKYQDHLIPFPTTIPEEIFSKYHRFFVTFYYNPSKRDGHLRELEELYNIETLSQLEKRRRKYRTQNMRRWIMERFARYAVVHIALFSTAPLWIGQLPGSHVTFDDPQPVLAESAPPELAQLTGPTSLKFFWGDEPVDVFLLKNVDDQNSLLLSPVHWDKVDEHNQIELRDHSGNTHIFFVVTLSDGNKALIRLAEPAD